MRFTDRTLLRLADPAERAALLSPEVGGALLRAAYVLDEVALGDVTAVHVRAVTLTPVVHPARTAAATARESMAATLWQVSVDLQAPPAPAGQAFLEVDVTATTRGVVSEVVAVASTDLSALADLDALDARIVAADGALPGDPTARDARRAEALRDALVAAFPDTDPAAVRAALDARGLVSLPGLRAWLEPPNRVERLALTVVTDSTAPATDRTYRVRALVAVVEDLGAGMAEALTALSLARATLAAGSDPQPVQTGMTPRLEYPALLLTPVDGLDDDDLPFPAGQNPNGAGARRAARLAELTTRLRPAAVVPVAV